MSTQLPLHEEFQYYLTHQPQLVEQYNGRVVVIKDHQVLGAYDTEFQAFQETSKQHKPGTFLIQLCTPGPDAYTQIFHRAINICNR
jgi:hypothetical protein